MENKTEPVPNGFGLLLAEQRKGKLMGDLSTELNKAVLAVREHGKKATLTLNITIEPFEQGCLRVSDKITSKLPTAKLPSNLFYATDDGVLTRDNPDQEELTLTPLPSATAVPTGVKQSAQG